MSDTATTIRTKVHNLQPGDVIFDAQTPGGLLVVEVGHDPKFGTRVTFHTTSSATSFPIDFSVYRVVEA